MYQANHEAVSVISLLTDYNSSREETLTRRSKEIARLQLKCEDTKYRLELLNQFTEQFFEERQKVREMAMSALDMAIEKGDADIASIILAIINKEYSKDFFGMMNRISGLR